MLADPLLFAMSIPSNLQSILDRMVRAADSVGRSPDTVTLVAVTKTVSVDKIREAYDAGHRDFGESRLQEAIPKVEVLPQDIRWHFIGTLQSNKAKRIGQIFSVVHTFDSEKQLIEAAKCGRQIEGFVEVNIANEAQKAGISASEVDEYIKVALHYPQVQISGLMTIGPQVDDPEVSRQYFRELKAIVDRCGLKRLSMGMSHDFEIAIQEGSTHVRVGSAIFGSRN